MKKVLLLIFAVLSISASAQQANADFPYAQLLGMSRDELLAHDFKFNANNNRFTSGKVRFKKLVDAPITGIVPADSWVKATIDMGVTGMSRVSIRIYSTTLFHNIMEFAKLSGTDYVETNDGDNSSVRFKYGGYKFALWFTRSITNDDTYGKTYTLWIDTGIPAASARQLKREK